MYETPVGNSGAFFSPACRQHPTHPHMKSPFEEFLSHCTRLLLLSGTEEGPLLGKQQCSFRDQWRFPTLCIPSLHLGLLLPHRLGQYLRNSRSAPFEGPLKIRAWKRLQMGIPGCQQNNSPCSSGPWRGRRAGFLLDDLNLPPSLSQKIIGARPARGLQARPLERNQP